MAEPRDGSPWTWVRIALVVFVLAWILGPTVLRDSIPLLLVFAIALGLELHFFVSAVRGGSVRRPDRLPQEVDRERYGYHPEPIDDADTEFAGAEAQLVDEPEVEEEEEPAPQSIRTPLQRFALGLGVLAALGALAWYVDSRSGWNSLAGDTRAAAVQRFSAEASRIAEKPVSVRCDVSRDYVGAVQHADGVAVVGGDLAIVTPEICDDLYRLAFKGETTGSRTGRALAVLAHEAWHLRGVRDEATAECYALQSGVALGKRMGLSEGTARQLMREQLTENALRGPDSLGYRVSSECRDGGRLDLHRASSRFP